MRTVKFESIENFRDLGGYPCDYGETSFGVIYRSATLAYASEKDMGRLAEIGIKTVIDLREDRVKEELPNPAKDDPRFTYISLPVNGNGRLPVDHQDQVDSYLEMLEDPYSARNIFRAILNAPKPLVFHCNAGKDRTGAFSMVLLLLAGVSVEDINADYMLSFPLLPKMTKNTRTYHPEVPELLLIPNTDFLPEVVETFFERYGSLENYFEAIGMSDDEFQALINILGKQERSCGAVFLRQGRVLIEQIPNGGFTLVKGHVEECDKDDFDTAKRELFEETGLQVDHFYEGFSNTIFYSPAPGTFKEVRFFAAEVKEGEMVLQQDEVKAAFFLMPSDAMRVLSHDSDRQVLQKALYFVYPQK